MLTRTSFSRFAWRTMGRSLLGPGGRYGTSILIFHRVLADHDPLRPNEPTAEEFDGLIGFLTRNFELKPLERAVCDAVGNGGSSHSIAITFDDGYADNVELALPILRRHQAPATFFIASGLLDGGRMWNDIVIEAIRSMQGPELDLRDFGLGHSRIDSPAGKLATIRRIIPLLKYRQAEERREPISAIEERSGKQLAQNLMMTTSQLRHLADEPLVDIGAHTVSHPILKNQTEKEAKREIITSKECLEDMTKKNVACFAYPNGIPDKDFDVRDVGIVKDAGFKIAVSTSPGGVHAGSNLYQLPRFTPWDKRHISFGIRMLITSRQRGDLSS